MKKTVTIIAVLVVIGAGVGVGMWLLGTQNAPPSPATDQVVLRNSGQSAQDPAIGEVSVHMSGSKFVPETVTVKKGTKVTWVNDDSMQHNVVADEAITGGLPLQNNLLNKGASYSFTFDTVGTFDYHCVPHPFMTAKIVVVQ